jgi:hypothetical protein
VVQSLTVGISLFAAGFLLTTMQASQLRAFLLGMCAGAASLSQYSVVGISTVAAAGLLLLILAPVCGLAGSAAGTFLALAIRRRAGVIDDAAAE